MAKPGTPEFDLLVREVVREMTIKAGQMACGEMSDELPAIPDDLIQAVDETTTNAIVHGHQFTKGKTANQLLVPSGAGSTVAHGGQELAR